jgi:hypothetical protein
MKMKFKVLWLLCFLIVGSIGAKAEVTATLSDDGATLTISNSSTTAEKISVSLSSVDRTKVTKLVIEGGFDGDDDFVNNTDWGITELDLSKAVLGTNWKFVNMAKMTTIDWPTTGTFEIPSNAFQSNDQSQLTDITIPSNCTKIGSQAFPNNSLENITIAGPSTYLMTGAFGNCTKVKSVKVLSGEENDASGSPYCALGAFAYDVTYVQTQIANIANAAKLTFPTGEDAYFTNQNIGMIGSQGELNTYKSNATNGWQEFINNDNVIVIEGGKVFRTFSDTKEHTFAACNGTSNGIELFYVIGTSGTKAKLLQMNKSNSYTLPANTGAVLYTTAGMLIYKSTSTETTTKVSQYVGEIPGNSGKTNYLESLQDAPESLWMSWSSTLNGTTYRNMFLSQQSDDGTVTGWGFYSIIPKTYSHADYAYRAFLNIPTSICSQDVLQKFTVEGGNNIDPDNGTAKILDLALPEDDVTGISNIQSDSKTSSDNAYYTLTGMKVSQPEKGIYIHNGKKIIFK